MINIQGIEHIGIASRDPQKTRWFFATALQLKLVGEEEVIDQQVNTICYSSKTNDSDSPLLEILVPTADSSVIRKFIDRRGGGIHHLALRVADIDHAVEQLKAKGVQFVSDNPQTGINNTRVIFVHPRDCGGLLIELVERT